MLSGIAVAAELQAYGIEPRADLRSARTCKTTSMSRSAT
jgi:hypothetical protein